MTSSPALAPDATVSVTGISKWFGQKVAVSDVTCSFGAGVTGLLGPNGAGKTTLLRLITGLLAPSEGQVTVYGQDPRRSPEVFERLALVPEEDAVYPFLTATEFVEYAARLSGAPASAAAPALAAVTLTADADRPLRTFSKGMRQRAKVAAALVGDAETLVLDEPLNGTDPVQRAHLITTFRRLADEGRTVIVSSHVLAEVERMADRVIAVVDGRLAAAGDVSAIRRAMSDTPYRVRIGIDPPRAVASALLTEEAVSSVTVENGTLLVETTDLAALGRAVPDIARRLDARFMSFQPEDESLESVFRYLVRRR